MLAEGYARIDRRMSIMSRPELRNLIRRDRGVSVPPLARYKKDFDRFRSFSAAPALSNPQYFSPEKVWNPPRTPEQTKTDDDIELKPLIIVEKKITTGSLMVLLYFWTCGGPFGVETAVASGGALLTWLGMFMAAIFWSLPQAIMAAELSLMIDVNGGNIIWIKRAFGDAAAFVNAHCYLVLNLSTLSLLVILFVEYIPSDVNLGCCGDWGLRIGFVFFVVLINVIGVQWLARLSTFFLIVIFSPFFAEMIAIVVYRVPVNFHALATIPPWEDIQWKVLISTVIWSFGGFDSVGSVAGDVKGGKRTFLLGVTGSFPLVLLNYFFPIMLDFIIDPNLQHWEEGYFTSIVFLYFPYWLGIWITSAAAISNFAQCSSGLAPISWVVWAMAHGEETGGHPYLPSFLGWEWQPTKGGDIRPLGGILFVGVAILAFSALKFEILLQFFLLLRIVNLLFEYAALIWLKFKEPNTHRPYKVPFGKVGAVLLVLPTVGIAVLSLVVADWMALALGGGTIVVVVIVWCGLSLVRYCVGDRERGLIQ